MDTAEQLPTEASSILATTAEAANAVTRQQRDFLRRQTEVAIGSIDGQPGPTMRQLEETLKEAGDFEEEEALLAQEDAAIKAAEAAIRADRQPAVNTAPFNQEEEDSEDEGETTAAGPSSRAPRRRADVSQYVTELKAQRLAFMRYREIRSQAPAVFAKIIQRVVE